MNAEKILELAKGIFIGTSASTLMKIGVASLAFGMWDVAIYIFDSYFLEKDVQHPGDSFGWMQTFGLSCFLLGLLIKLKQYHKENNSALRDERLKFKLNYKSLADVELQDEFERLYSTRNADVRAIKNILNHPNNKNQVIDLFTACHLNVLPEGDWFKEKDKYLNLRYNLGFLIWLLFPLLILLAIFFAVAEFFAPGITNSGAHALWGYIGISIAAGAGAKLLLTELSAMGQAITLVRKYKP
ncbi:hypothetical protein ACK33N_11460 [Aeromonas veronii]|uniref:hypothetical protein n=1 Tax=Aeromonas veronii TaxID=654 RepID=UPI003A3B0C3A